MGRPVQKRNFGDPAATAGNQMFMFGDIGVGIEQVFIVRQKATRIFLVESVASSNQGEILIVDGPGAVTGVGFGYQEAGASGGNQEVDAATVAAIGVTYDVADTITLTGGSGTQAVLTVALVTPIDAEDETDYAANFSEGLGYAASDIITMTDGTEVTVDTINFEVQSAPAIQAIGVTYDVGDDVDITGTGTDATLTVLLVTPVDGQDEGDYSVFDGGDGAGGTAHVALDVLTMTDGTEVTVDSVDGNDDVLTFTVDSTTATSGLATNVLLAQASSTGSGTEFSMTLADLNQGVFSLTLVTGGDYSVDLVDPVATTSAQAGTGLTVNVTTDSTVTEFTVDSTTATSGLATNVTLAQASVAPAGGTGFDMTLVDANQGIFSVTVTTPGDYSSVPGNPVSQGSTSGAGSLATFNLVTSSTSNVYVTLLSNKNLKTFGQVGARQSFLVNTDGADVNLPGA